MGDISVSNVTAITSCAVVKIGTETAAPEIANVKFRDIDALDCGRAAVIMVRDGARVHDICFENVFVERCRGANRQRLIDLLIEQRGGLGHIEHVQFVNFSAAEPSDNPPQVCGFDDGHRVRNITFRGLTVAGKAINKAGDLPFDVRFAENIRFVAADGRVNTAASQDAEPAYRPYPLPAGVSASKQYNVFLNVTAKGKKEPVPVAEPAPGGRACVAAFGSYYPVAVHVKVAGPINDLQIDPPSEGVYTRVRGSRAALILTEPGQVQVRIDDLPPLLIKAEPLREDAAR
jgi:hypothetical protein